jgi:hypothetical protein
MQTVTERRQHKRFRAIDGAFAAATDGSVQIGPIKDISRGGLAFHYIGSDKNQSITDQIDIFLSGNQFHLTKVPIKPITDIELTKDIPFSSVPMRQMSVQFGKLEDAQRAALENFLVNHTAGQA